MLLGNTHIINAKELNKDIKIFINEYVNFVDTSLAKLTIEKEKANIFYESDDNLEYLYLSTLINHRKLQISDLTYTNYNTNIEFHEINPLKNGNLKIAFSKHSKINYKSYENTESEEITEHNIEIKQDSNSYKIIKDDFTDDLKEELTTNNNTITKLNSYISNKLKDEKLEINTIKKQINSVKV